MNKIIATDDSVTVSLTAPEETGETGKTGSLSNDAFLRTVFGNAQENTRPVIVAFDGNPNNAHKSKWFGHGWTGAETWTPSANTYFSLATFTPDAKDTYRRRKSNFAALHAVVLDDIGTKVKAERITLVPSWKLETSPGNYQYGYLLDEPLTDGSLAERLMDAVLSAGLCDPGLNGPCARLVRLPVGSNGKHTPPFECRMTEWTPERRYTVQALVDGLQLDLQQATKRPGRQTNRPAQAAPEVGDPVWMPCPEENTVLAALRSRGLYKTPLGSGRHDVTCPWHGEHTDGADDGAAYFEPDDNWPIGGFKCHHGHCADRHIRDLLLHLGVEVGEAGMRATIRLMQGELPRIVDYAERELAASGSIYQRGGLITAVVTDPGTKETRIQAVTQPALMRTLALVAAWERFDGRAKDWVRADPSERITAILLDAPSYPHLPVLNGLARQPYLRQDGSLARESGYDRATGMFGVFDARAFDVPDNPTRDDAQAALAMLHELLSEFAFAAEEDQAAALSALLTAVIRPSLEHAPMFHVKAHAISSGKSYLCALVTAFATPQRGTPMSFPGDDEECRKLLLASLLTAPAVVEFDNLTGDLVPHRSLCTALTSEFLSGRILGVSKTASVSTRTLFLSSGNNVGPVRDMSRRCVSIGLSPQVEIPAERTFLRPDLVADVRRERERYVSAALTVVRAWLVAGRPKTTCRALAGFEQWSDLCRQPLLWLGLPDPASPVFESMATDPDRELLAQLLAGWHEAFDRKPVTVREAIRLANAIAVADEAGGLRDVLLDIACERGEINPRRLGWWIKRHAGGIVNRQRFVCEGASESRARWWVETILPVLPVSPVSSGAVSETVTATEDECEFT